MDNQNVENYKINVVECVNILLHKENMFGVEIQKLI